MTIPRRTVFLPVLVVAALVATLAAPAAAEHVTPARVEGPDRYATAAGIARLAFSSSGADTAFVASGETFPDALAGAFPAGLLGGPVLLTRPGDAPQATLAALDELGVQTVVVLGGEAAVRRDVADQLRAEGYEVQRVRGADRYATAAEIAVVFGDGGHVGTVDGQRTAIVAGGEAFADALAAGPLSAGAHLPLLLTERDRSHPAMETALERLDIERVVIAGGTAAVSEAVRARLHDAGYTTERVAGRNRMHTARALASFAIDRFGWTPALTNLARGDAFPDALAAGPYAGATRSPVLLAAAPDVLSAETAAWFEALCPAVETVRAVGGTAAVSTAVLSAAVDAAQRCEQPTHTDQTYILAPQEAQTAQAPHDFELAVAGRYDDEPFTGPVHLALFPCQAVDALDAPVTFADADGDGHADGIGSTDTGLAEITSVHGVATQGRHLADAQPGADGVIEFTVGSQGNDCTVVVAYTDENGNAQLDVDAEGRPTEPFGVTQVGWSG